MVWMTYALLMAFFNSFKSVAIKKSLRGLDEYVVSWFIFFLPAVFILPVFLFVAIPDLGDTFLPTLVAGCLLNVVAMIWSTRALIGSDLSLTTPMTAFSPIFMLLTSYLMLGEFPDSSGLIGVVLIVLGAYCLHLEEWKNGWKAPLLALVKDKGPRLMLGATFIWSVTANLDKMAINVSSPMFFALTANLLMAMMLFPWAYPRLRDHRKKIKQAKINLLAVGFFSAGTAVFQMIALSQTLAVYVMAIKRVSIFLSILLGGLIFKEKNLRSKLLGGAIMILGVIFITIL